MKYTLSIALIIMTKFLFSQKPLWSPVDQHARINHGVRYITPKKFKLFSFDQTNFVEEYLDKEPSFIFEVPNLDGSFEKFGMRSTPVFSDELATKYPGFYSLSGKNESGDIIKMSVSPMGINIMILRKSGESIFIDPISLHDHYGIYQLYEKNELPKKKGAFKCGFGEFILPEFIESIEDFDQKNELRSLGDCSLRSYRLALSCTGEYAQFHGGTVQGVLAAYNNTMTRVNGIYERDLGVTMRLIADTDKLIFLNPTSDPFNNNNSSILIQQNQTTTNQIIGVNNYDIGHVFSTGGGGLASLRAVCSSDRKASGVTGRSEPVGDPFDVDYVAHEMGHQFGGNHTQNNNCSRNLSTAVEPGSGSTIMAYAGICEPNIQNNSDAYFHATSLAEMYSFIIAGGGRTCATILDQSNNAPVLSLSRSSYNIPVSTGFVLDAEGFDEDGDILTYTWEQTDNQTATMPPRSSNRVGPAFRSLSPSQNSKRYFPDLRSRYATWEVLPNLPRTMNFICTVRDNNPVYGCTDESKIEVNIVGTKPFVVLYPNTPVKWQVGNLETIRWDTAETRLSPILCTSVDIYLSTDGGASYPILIASNVPNVGSFEIEVPSQVTNRARIMVKAHDNIFYDVSNANFEILASFVLDILPKSVSICDEDKADINIKLISSDVGEGDILLNLEQTITNLRYQFTSDIITSLPTSVDLEVFDLQTLNLGVNSVRVTANRGVEKLSQEIELIKNLNTNKLVKYVAPSNNDILQSKKFQFKWEEVRGVFKYIVQVAQNPQFSNPIVNEITDKTFLEFTPKGAGILYWRVKAVSPCFDNDFSPVNQIIIVSDIVVPGIVLLNEVLAVPKGGTANWSISTFNVLHQDPESVAINIVALPNHGTLFSGNTILGPGDIFTLQQIIDGTISYLHGGGEVTDDEVIINVFDDKRRVLGFLPLKIKIIDESYLVIATKISNNECGNNASGVIQAQVFGGQEPYAYSINGLDYTNTSKFENLSPGEYKIYVQDARGEIDTSNIVVIDSTHLIQLELDQTFYKYILKAKGGLGDFQYSIDNVIFDEQNEFLIYGFDDITFYARDEVGCLSALTHKSTVDQLVVTTIIEDTLRCFGQNIPVNIFAVGGYAPYSYSVNGTNYNINNRPSLGAGQRILYIRDAGGLIVTDTIFIPSPSIISVNPVRKRFQYIVNASGGRPPYEYSLNNNQYFSNDTIIFEKNGAYRLTVRDASLCTQSFNISVNLLSNVNLNQKNISCHGGTDGYVRLVPLDGVPPFEYSWNGGAFGTNREFANLQAGLYPYIIVDSKQDTLVGSALITEPQPLIAYLQLESNVTTIVVEGGTPPYRYSLNGGITFLDTPTYEDLPEGLYQVIVQDINNCETKFEGKVTSTKNFVKDLISIGPNPTSDIIQFRHHFGTQDLQLKIYNVLGLEIQHMTNLVSEHQYEIETNTWQRGVYFLEVFNENFYKTYKVIVN